MQIFIPHAHGTYFAGLQNFLAEGTVNAKCVRKFRMLSDAKVRLSDEAPHTHTNTVISWDGYFREGGPSPREG